MFHFLFLVGTSQQNQEMVSVNERNTWFSYAFFERGWLFTNNESEMYTLPFIFTLHGCIPRLNSFLSHHRRRHHLFQNFKDNKASAMLPLSSPFPLLVAIKAKHAKRRQRKKKVATFCGNFTRWTNDHEGKSSRKRESVVAGAVVDDEDEKCSFLLEQLSANKERNGGVAGMQSLSLFHPIKIIIFFLSGSYSYKCCTYVCTLSWQSLCMHSWNKWNTLRVKWM